MSSFVRTSASTLAAVALVAGLALAPEPAAARGRGFPVAAGILGGLALGAIIAGSAQASQPAYYAPAPVYAPEPAYEAPPCWRERVPQYGYWHEFIGWRYRRVCG